MMDTPLEARLAVAHDFATALDGEPGVVGVLCGGSTGRGHPDRWSDLELLVVWAQPPTDAQRRIAPAKLDGAALRLFPFEPAEFAAADDFWFGPPGDGGLLVEVGHLGAADLTAALDRLLVEAEPDPVLLSLASAFATGRPMAGDLTPWRERVTEYPQPLADAAVRRHGQIDFFWRWRMYVDREDPHGLRRHFAGVATALTHMACALSGRFWPGLKWPTRTLADLPVSPVDLDERLRAVDGMAPEAAAAALTDLVEESYDLVELRAPDVDVDRLREIFRFDRTPWPPGT
jgi:hypothetical protein